MTKRSGDGRCSWCRRPVIQNPGAGRPRKFCSRSHRQRAYEARRRAEACNLPAGQVIVSEEELERLHDRLYRLESAVADVTGDLDRATGAKAYREAFDHLYDSAKDLVGLVIEPVRE